MIFDPDCRLGYHISFLDILRVVDPIFESILGHQAYVYSANDREHSKGSLHYKSRAWDFRNFMNNDPKSERHPKIVREKVTEALIRELGPDFDVLEKETHWHVEYDPKK